MQYQQTNAATFPISDYVDLRIAVSKLQKIPFLASASELDRSLVITIFTELGTNIVKYAGYGRIDVSLVEVKDGKGVEICAQDDGPGISDVELAMQDHYSTGNSLGLGLPGVQRMADKFEIVSRPGCGTRVNATRLLGKVHPGLAATPVPVGSASQKPALARPSVQRWDVGTHVRPMSGHLHCGDLALVITGIDFLLLCIVDVTGHGEPAHFIARRINDLIELNHYLQPREMMQLLHNHLKGTVGAAAGILRIQTATGSFCYLGVGNTGIIRVNGERWRGISRDGVLGFRLPTLLENSGNLSSGDALLLWTDGVSETAASAFFAQHYRDPVGQVARRLVNEHGKPHDDAGCIVLRWLTDAI